MEEIEMSYLEEDFEEEVYAGTCNECKQTFLLIDDIEPDECPKCGIAFD